MRPEGTDQRDRVLDTCGQLPVERPFGLFHVSHHCRDQPLPGTEVVQQSRVAGPGRPGQLPKAPVADAVLRQFVDHSGEQDISLASHADQIYQLVNSPAMRIEHELVIRAPVEKVWELTERIEDWPSLSSNFSRIERLDDGPLRLGSRARVSQPGLGTRVWTVTRLQPRTLFEWQTKLGSVRMTGTHLLAPEGDGCRSTLLLTLRGPGAGLLGRLAGQRMQEAVRNENSGMAASAERLAHGGE